MVFSAATNPSLFGKKVDEIKSAEGLGRDGAGDGQDFEFLHDLQKNALKVIGRQGCRWRQGNGPEPAGRGICLPETDLMGSPDDEMP